MSWTKIISKATKEKSKIKFSIATAGKGNRFYYYYISFPSAISGQLGFEKSDIERVDIMLGSEENDGKLCIVPCADGEFKIKRLINAITIKTNIPAGVMEREDQALLDYTKLESGGFVISLPEWALPLQRKNKNEKPGSLLIQGNTLIYGSREIKFPSAQLFLVKFLVDAFGTAIDTNELYAQMCKIDSIGMKDGANIYAIAGKINESFKSVGMLLTIETKGSDILLRRSIT
jgi:hypothetical protein